MVQALNMVRQVAAGETGSVQQLYTPPAPIPPAFDVFAQGDLGMPPGALAGKFGADLVSLGHKPLRSAQGELYVKSCGTPDDSGLVKLGQGGAYLKGYPPADGGKAGEKLAAYRPFLKLAPAPDLAPYQDRGAPLPGLAWKVACTYWPWQVESGDQDSQAPGLAQLLPPDIGAATGAESENLKAVGGRGGAK